MIVTAMPRLATRSSSLRLVSLSCGPALRTGPEGFSRRASVASGAEPSPDRQPCRRASAAAGTPRAGIVTELPPLTKLASVRRTGNTAPPAIARQC